MITVKENSLEKIKGVLRTKCRTAGKLIYQRTIWAMLALAILTNIYLINDFGVINRSSLKALWLLKDSQGDNVSSLGLLGHLIWFIHQCMGLSIIVSGHLIMIICFSSMALVLILISRLLSFSLMSQWALIFLLLSHPSFNDFRRYIIVEPLFWLCWLVALYVLFRFHRSHSLLAIFAWLIIFLLASRLNITAWFWLLLFPFGALFWKPWRRKSVSYALLGYAFFVGILLLLPIYQGISPLDWLKQSILANPETLSQVLSLNNNNWIQEDDKFMAGIFIFSGAISLIIVRLLISFGIVSVFLTAYAVLRGQYHVIKQDYLRIILYAIIFDLIISVILLVLSKDNDSILSFSPSLLLILFAALGLSYALKKMISGGYSQHKILVIVWCLVAYFASGFIIFGTKKDYLKLAGESFVGKIDKSLIYSNSDYYLFYVGGDIKNMISPKEAIYYAQYRSIQYAYDRNRHTEIPQVLLTYKPVKTFSNRRGDTIYIYQLGNRDKNE